MKKLLGLMVLLTASFTLAACDSSQELPDVRTWHINEAREELQDLGFEVYAIPIYNHNYGQPDLVIDYQDYSHGDDVEQGTVLNILISDFEDDDELDPAPRTPIDPDGEFTSEEDVALYVDAYGELPENFVSLDEASEEGYDPESDDLWDYFDGYSLGGHVFEDAGDHDALPNGDRTYYMANLNYEGGSLSDDYLVYSDDGLIYSTTDLDSGDFTQHFGNEDHPPLDKDERYTNLEDVMLYIRTFGKLPPNYVIRYEEHVSNYQSLYGYTPDYVEDYDFPRSVGDMRDEHGEDAYFGYWTFSNYAGQMPETSQFYMADINISYPSTSRGNSRIVFSPEERIVYYTPDHYNTFELWYGDARE